MVKDKKKVTTQNVGRECWFLLRHQSESNETTIYKHGERKKNKENKYKSHFGDNVRESGK